MTPDQAMVVIREILRTNLVTDTDYIYDGPVSEQKMGCIDKPPCHIKKYLDVYMREKYIDWQPSRIETEILTKKIITSNYMTETYIMFNEEGKENGVYREYKSRNNKENTSCAEKYTVIKERFTISQGDISRCKQDDTNRNIDLNKCIISKIGLVKFITYFLNWKTLIEEILTFENVLEGKIEQPHNCADACLFSCKYGCAVGTGSSCILTCIGILIIML